MKLYFFFIALFLGHHCFAAESVEKLFQKDKVSLFGLKKDLTTLKENGDQKAMELLKRLKLYGLWDKGQHSLIENSLHPNSTQVKSTEMRVKKELQFYLKSSYLRKLESVFGECGSNHESCLHQTADYMKLNLPQKELCFPYTQCGFYKCMEEKYKCREVGNVYFTELAYPTCSFYVKRVKAKRFTEKGIDWIYRVMVCLQKGLIDECEVRGNCDRGSRKKTCDHITRFTLDFHPGCYLNSGAGVCHLPLKDKVSIWKTVSPYLTNDERVQAFKVVMRCLTSFKGP